MLKAPNINIESINVSLLLVIAAIIVVAGWAFALGMLYSKVNEISILSSKIYIEVSKQDERIDKLEVDHITQIEFKELRDSFIELRTQHREHHRKEDK